MAGRGIKKNHVTHCGFSFWGTRKSTSRSSGSSSASLLRLFCFFFDNSFNNFHASRTITTTGAKLIVPACHFMPRLRGNQ